MVEGDALLAAACFALAPDALGGIEVHTDRGPSCERWLDALRAMLPESKSLRRLPPQIDDERLLGGNDLAATLRTGRPNFLRGLLCEADGGVILVSLAERLQPRVAALIGAAMDTGEVETLPARFGLIALDGGEDAQEGCPALLTERLAIHIDLRAVDPTDLAPSLIDRVALEGARARFDGVVIEQGGLGTLCATAAAFGIVSMRAVLQASRVARASAALDDRDRVEEADLEAAARLVLAPRARALPTPAPESQAESEPELSPADGEQPQPTSDADEAPDKVVEATRAAIPAGLLASLMLSEAKAKRSEVGGRAGAAALTRRRGRPIGVRAGSPRQGSRLNVLATLRAAAPWQRWRRRQQPQSLQRVLVRAEDFRITRYRQRTETVTVFVLDASGSSAMHRLAECKGAVELLLAECYVRRDQVAVITFRGRGAELIVPPTRSLVRAKRSLAGVPGGGSTPLACGLDLACDLAEQLRRRGMTPLLVVLTDGNANVARDGGAGRVQAGEDALSAARRLRAGLFNSLLIDTAPRPQAAARALAQSMHARYLPLPHADARELLAAVNAAA